MRSRRTWKWILAILMCALLTVTIMGKSAWAEQTDIDTGSNLAVQEEIVEETLAGENALQSQMIDILYQWAGGKISCDFDGYVNTSGRHEGIDFCAYGGYGTPIYSLISGEVIYCTNSSSLSTCSIYDYDHDKSVIYLHGHFDVSVGSWVSQGDYLGWECNNGASSAHTHIEVRNGWRQKAAKSVNDYTLDNSNPYSYWESVIGTVPPAPDPDIDWRFPVPCKAYARNSGRVSVYNGVNGELESNRYIDGSTDLCTIEAVYTAGWCRVNYPISGGSRTAYVPLSEFYISGSPYGWYADGQYTAYCRSSGGETIGRVDPGDDSSLIGTENGRTQIVYPVTGEGYYKMGWIDRPTSPPSDVWISSDRTSYTPDDTLYFNVGADNANGGYTIGIDKDGEGRVITEGIGNSYSVAASRLGEGSFSAYVTAYNDAGYTDSDRIYFSIAYQGSAMTSGYDRTLPDGDYMIVNAVDGNCYLDIVGGDYPAKSGTNVNLWRAEWKTNEDTINDHDVWTLKYENGFYRITQYGQDMSLDVYGCYTANGTNVQVYPSHDSYAQQWAISTNSRNGYRIQARCSGYSLDVKDGKIEAGSNIWQYIGNDTDAQSWVFIPYKPTQPIADGRYVLLSAMDRSLELDVSGDSSDIPNGTNVQIWKDTCASQYNSFDIKALSNGYYKLTHVASGKALESYNGDSILGANIDVYDANGYSAQQWAITKVGDAYVLRARCNGYAMDVVESGKENGTNVVAWPYSGNSLQPNQAWYFVPAEYKVTYNNNGGGTAPAAQTKYYKTNLTLGGAITRTGYTFKNWNTKADGSGNSYAAGAKYTVDANLTLYAQWIPNTYTISYDLNGATGTIPDQTKTHGEDLTLSSTIPSRNSRYEFVGWNTDKNSTVALYSPSGKYTTDSDATLYAIWKLITKPIGGLWKAESTVGGEIFVSGWVFDNDDLKAAVYVDVYVGGPADGTGNMAGRFKADKPWTFLETALPEAGANHLFEETIKVSQTGTQEVYVYAINIGEGDSNPCLGHSSVKVLVPYTISYDLNGGTGEITSQIKTEGQDLRLSGIEPKRSGYTFIGWNTNKNASNALYQPNDIYSADSDVTLYAIWKADPTPIPTENVVFQVGSVSGKAGADVVVPVSITKNPGIAGFSLDVSYDNKVLTLKSIEADGRLGGTLSANGNVVNWFSSDNVKATGTIFNVTFTIVKDATATSANVNLVMHGDNHNVVDENSNNVPAAFNKGVVTIAKFVYGDVTGDGDVTIADVVKINRHVLEKIQLTGTELLAADVTGDNDVTIADVVKVNRFVLEKITSLDPAKGQSLAGSLMEDTEDTAEALAGDSLAATVTVGNVEASAGEVVEIPVTLSDNPGIAGLAFEFLLPDGVELSAITSGEMLADGVFSINENVVSWYAAENIFSNGTLMKLAVQANKPGEYTIKAMLKKNAPSNLSDENGDAVDVVFKEGTLQVRGEDKPEPLPATLKVANISTKANATKNQTGTLKVSYDGDGELTFVSSNSKIKVDANGKFTIPKNYAGTATITVTASATENYEAATATAKITVSKIANTISANAVTKIASAKAQSFTLAVKQKGKGKLTFKSSSASVSVTNAGTVTIAKNFSGRATITINAAAAGIYKAATKSVTVTVKPANVTVGTAKNSAAGKVTLTWKKAAGAGGYQIQYSTSKNFKNAKSVTVKSASTVKGNLTKLVKGKTYYIRIRAFKKDVAGNLFSKWTSFKTLKVTK